MNSFLTHLHADIRRTRLTRRGATHHAEDVRRGLHKEYERMEQIHLPKPALSSDLAQALTDRYSGSAGAPEVPVSLQEFGTLLGLSLGKHPDVINRNYPSGGALYPVETYVISTAMESQTPGAFHYNPTKHTLERLWALPESFSLKEIARHPEDLFLSSLIVFTSVWMRSGAKYGDLAYQHALIEAGHMSQNVLLVGCALGLSVRPYAGFEDSKIATLLDLDESLEQTVHTVTVCKK